MEQLIYFFRIKDAFEMTGHQFLNVINSSLGNGIELKISIVFPMAKYQQINVVSL